jgi:hypothetical protein
MEPYKCEYVPKSAILWFLWKHKVVWKGCVEGYEKYMSALHSYNECRSDINRHAMKCAHKKYLTSDSHYVEALRALAKLYFNYEDSYVNGPDFLSRCYRIHKSQRTL